MEGTYFDELEFYRSIARSGARALLIGRRAILAYGINVMTSDYDFWIEMDDIEIFNKACEPFEMIPNRTPDEARKFGRYVLENSEHVDVLVARRMPTVDGQSITFKEAFEASLDTPRSRKIDVRVPQVEHLIMTKRFGARPKDASDINLLNEFLERIKV